MPEPVFVHLSNKLLNSGPKGRSNAKLRKKTDKQFFFVIENKNLRISYKY